jgi:hypothetical protein
MKEIQLSTVQRVEINGFETFDMRFFEKAYVKRLTSHVKRLIQTHVKRLTVDNFDSLACETSRLHADAPRQKDLRCAGKECLGTETALSRHLPCRRKLGP